MHRGALVDRGRQHGNAPPCATRGDTCREERDTDKSVDKCRLRYAVFKRHYPALVRLQKLMPFSVIDATGSVEECEAQIAHELRYQSSLDLDERTYASITTLPLAREVVQHSRKALVSRLDDYCLLHTDTYGQVRRSLLFFSCSCWVFGALLGTKIRMGVASTQLLERGILHAWRARWGFCVDARVL